MYCYTKSLLFSALTLSGLVASHPVKSQQDAVTCPCHPARDIDARAITTITSTRIVGGDNTEPWEFSTPTGAVPAGPAITYSPTKGSMTIVQTYFYGGVPAETGMPASPFSTGGIETIVPGGSAPTETAKLAGPIPTDGIETVTVLEDIVTTYTIVNTMTTAWTEAKTGILTTVFVDPPTETPTKTPNFVKTVTVTASASESMPTTWHETTVTIAPPTNSTTTTSAPALTATVTVSEEVDIVTIASSTDSTTTLSAPALTATVTVSASASESMPTIWHEITVTVANPTTTTTSAPPVPATITVAAEPETVTITPTTSAPPFKATDSPATEGGNAITLDAVPYTYPTGTSTSTSTSSSSSTSVETAATVEVTATVEPTPEAATTTSHFYIDETTTYTKNFDVIEGPSFTTTVTPTAAAAQETEIEVQSEVVTLKARAPQPQPPQKKKEKKVARNSVYASAASQPGLFAKCVDRFHDQVYCEKAIECFQKSFNPSKCFGAAVDLRW